MSYGWTYLEYKSWMDRRINQLNKIQDADSESCDKKDLLKYNYGFATTLLNIKRVMKTDNYFFGVLFLKFGEQQAYQLNGTEWCSFYYREAW